MEYSSASEGEIMENERQKKATTTRTPGDDHKINGSDRVRSRVPGSEKPLRSENESDGLEYDDRSRSSRDSRDHSPNRRRNTPHGVKRGHPEDYRSSEQSDPRRFRVHYEEGDGRGGRHNQNRHEGRGDYYDSRNNRGKGSHRERNALPMEGNHGEMDAKRARRDEYRYSADRSNFAELDIRSRGPEGRSQNGQNIVSRQSTATAHAENRRGATKSDHTPGEANSGENEHGENETEQPPVLDETAMIEERRKRREILRAKHNRETPLLQQALHASIPVDVNAGLQENPLQSTSSGKFLAQSKQWFFSNQNPVGSPVSTAPSSPPPSSPASPLNIAVSDDAELANNAAQAHDRDSPAGPSAADYDPSMDMQEDRVLRHEKLDVGNTSVNVDDGKAKVVAHKNEEPLEFDMFADDVDNDSPENKINLHKDDGLHAVGGLTGKQLDKSLLDDWDDPEGYYRIILGEILDKRYQIQTNLGKGVFSAVVRATDNQTGNMVAIKIIRKQESMYKAGLKEIHTLEKLSEADLEDKKHVIRLERHFMHKGHLCMVFEHLSINLREVLKKFGRDVGINIRAVRAYAQQMFLGLSLLKKCDVLHADLKPDNVLVNENRSQLKIADLGSAIDIRDSEVTDILVSRFYRAPEIMLGIKGDFALDMWSIGCTLFELYTGRICFTGPTNNQMLKGILECRGKIPNRVLKRAEYWAQHFDADGTFLSQEYDNVTRKEVVRRINIVRPVPAKELKSRLFANSTGLSNADVKELSLFADLLDRCLALDPLRRITPNEALRHGFINRVTNATPGSAKGK